MSETENTRCPWKDFPQIWKTEALYWAWMRSLLRKGWSKSPVKLEFIKQSRKRIVNARGKDVWGGECALCHKDFPAKEMNVDHIEDAGRLASIDDISPFVQRLLMCPISNMQYVCIPCHKIKSHSDKKKISYERATAEKQAIQVIKEKREKEVLTEAGITPGSNAKIRRDQLVELFSAQLKNENISDDESVDSNSLEE